MYTKQLSMAIVLGLFIISCSGSQGAIEYSYQYLSKKRQDAKTEVYKYRYKIGADFWRELDIYVKKDQFTYVITMEQYFENAQNRFVYNSLKTPNNFISAFREKPGTVNSVQEAIELALGCYIEDIKSVEIPEENIKYQ